MDLKEFAELIVTKVSEKLGKDAKVEVKVILKNNGVKLTGLQIHSIGANVVPIIYLNSYYELYKNGIELDEIVENMIRLNEQQRRKITGIDEIFEFENVKENIYYKLVNAEKNQEGLENKLHKSFLDMEKLYYIELDNFDNGNATSTINKGLLENWGVTEDEVYELAEKNMKKQGVCIESIIGIIVEHARQTGMEIDMDVVRNAEDLLYVATNKNKMYGASVIESGREALVEFINEKFESDAYVIFSSIHEIILLPKRDEEMPFTSDDIRYINSNEVQPEEVLSDNLYILRRNGEFEIVQA